MCPRSGFWGPGISKIIAFFCQGSTAGEDCLEEIFGTGKHLPKPAFRKNPFLLGLVFGRSDFSRIFVFEPRIFRGFCRRIFSAYFCGAKVPRKVLQENPRQNPPEFIQQTTRHISAEGLCQRLRTPFLWPRFLDS